MSREDTENKLLALVRERVPLTLGSLERVAIDDIFVIPAPTNWPNLCTVAVRFSHFGYEASLGFAFEHVEGKQVASMSDAVDATILKAVNKLKSTSAANHVLAGAFGK